MEPITNEQLIAMLQKAGITYSTGGILPAEARNAFIDATIEQSDFLKMISVERGPKSPQSARQARRAEKRQAVC